MANLDKQNAIYIEGVVIANGVKDNYGDILTKEDINKLMTSYVDKTVDTNHSFLEENGVSIVKNYTTEKAKTIHGRDVPVGSWVAEMMIWNEDIINSIHSHKFNGLSLASVPNKLEDIKAFFGQDNVNYRDFNDVDDLTPLMISLVKRAGNGYDFDVYPYDVYVKREDKKMEDKKMTDENTDMATVMKEMLSIIARSADQSPINKQSYDERFNAMDEKIDGLEERFDVKLDEKLNAFLEKLDSQTKTKEPDPKPSETKEEDPDPQEADPTPKKTKGGKKQKAKKEEPPVSVKRNAPITSGVENTEPYEYKTFKCPEPKVKRDYFGRPIR